MEKASPTPREYHARQEAERRAQREAFRLATLERVRAAVRKHAPALPAIQAVYLFGSLLQPGRFLQTSDIDVAVDCDDIRAETPFWRALEEELERNVDLRPRTGAVARAVEAYGELCYAREMAPAGA
ncbi:MAG TPA: nucleotidyltransferase domain-containing protein [Thermoanaerobaculia bacterium]|nr:nucleotidyltransferase domain-containing protein [Thermoanaerobaculia bacterium]